MKEIYLQLRQKARAIVSGLPRPEFYTEFSEEIAASEDLFASTPVLIKIKKEIIPLLENDFGHGVLHSVLVCRDAGAIVMIEMRNNIIEKNRPVSDIKLDSNIKETMTLVQIAGLLHDIKRKRKNHAQKGAEFAEKFLKKGYCLSSDEVAFICNAIREHEAFKQNSDSEKPYGKNNLNTGSLLSGALYDADKFRWGPDNFTHTVWDMVIFSNTPFDKFKKRYPMGMAKLAEIKNTFRTDTGKRYGPDFIELGIKAGEILLKTIQQDFPR